MFPSRMTRLLPLCCLALFSSCASAPPPPPVVLVVKVKVPEPLLIPTPKPWVPENATQRDIAVLLLEYDAALTVCNGQLGAIEWLNEQPTGQPL